MITELTLRGILSFAPDTPTLPMQPLNVLIGANGSGKSNLVEAVGLLRASSSKLTAPLRGKGGSGVEQWIHKSQGNQTASVEAVLQYPHGPHAIRHKIEFGQTAAQFELVDEIVESDQPDPGYAEPFFFYRYQNGHPAISIKDAVDRRQLRREDILPDESILSQRKDPDQYPELAFLNESYGDMKLYREWSFGRTSVFRQPQLADLSSHPLEEDFSNLGLFLSHLRNKPATKRKVIEHLKDLYEGLEEFDVNIRTGTVEVVLVEEDYVFPASRLSDGTLRYLCLLAILLDPDPPSLICIEEPELGLHPDMMPKLADLMKDASTRCQLIVTTHSDILVDAMTDQPESVVVVEKHNGASQLTRLENDAEMQSYLEKYRLGEAWTRGLIGGTR